MTNTRPFLARNALLLALIVGVPALIGADVAGVPLSARLPIALLMLAVGAYVALQGRLPAAWQLRPRHPGHVPVRVSRLSRPSRPSRPARPSHA